MHAPAPRQVTISDGGVLPNVHAMLVPKDGGDQARPGKASKPKSKPAASSGGKAAAPDGDGDAELAGDEGGDFSDGEGDVGTGGEGDDAADAPAQ
jgi:hypothetical protein